MNPLLSVNHLTKRFGGVVAQDNVSFSIYPNEICGLIGPNGAGKTTLFNLITGNYQPDEGNVTLCGKSIEGIPVNQLVEMGIARTFQNVELFPSMTVLENVLVGMYVRTKAGFWGAVSRIPWVNKEEKQSVDRAMKLLELSDLSHFAHHLAGELPVGRQKTAEIARALASNPKLLLLDEPAAGLNAVETETLGDLILKIRDQGIAIMLVEHDMNLAMGICDTILVLDQGRKLTQGTPYEIQNNKNVMEAYLGQDELC